MTDRPDLKIVSIPIEADQDAEDFLNHLRKSLEEQRGKILACGFFIETGEATYHGTHRTKHGRWRDVICGLTRFYHHNIGL